MQAKQSKAKHSSNTSFQETEIKILEINRSEIETKLLKLGAKKIFEGELLAEFYDTKDSDLKKEKKLLRLRKECNKTVLTLKSKVIRGGEKTAKIREENEVEVEDFKTMQKVLENLSFEIKHILRKTRISYKLKDAKFEFDKYHDDWKHIPEFLEIESDNIETIYKYAELLGFCKEDCKPWSGWDLEKHYSKKTQ